MDIKELDEVVMELQNIWRRLNKAAIALNEDRDDDAFRIVGREMDRLEKQIIKLNNDSPWRNY